MSFIIKFKNLIRIVGALIIQPKLRNAYIKFTKDFFRQPQLASAIMQQPRLIHELLAQLFLICQGFNYSREFKVSKNDNLARSSFDSSSEPNILKSYFDSHLEGRGIWKWNHYFDIYPQYFKKFVGQEVHILEIGIFSGGSLDMWRNYFGNKCRVYGVDIEQACKMYENEYTKISIGDQADRGFWKRFKDENPRIDILIDDGGHESGQQIVTLEEMLPHLSPGGVYLCEDIHANDNPFSSYLHGLVMNLNEISGGTFTGVKPSQFQSWIKSMHFYPYVTVIEKLEKCQKEFIAPRHGTEWQPFL